MANFYGTAGSDTLVGGDENDYIADELGGADVFDGGGGNDTLSIFRSSTMMAHDLVMRAGSGNDRITYAGHNESRVSIDAGDGDDWIFMRGFGLGSASVNLGIGRDVLELDASHVSAGFATFTITCPISTLVRTSWFGISFLPTTFTTGTGPTRSPAATCAWFRVDPTQSYSATVTAAATITRR